MLRSLLVTVVLGLATSAGFGAEVINFDVYPDGSPVPEGYTVHDQWESLGVVFTMGDSTRAAYAVPHTCSRSAPNHVGGDPVVIAWFVDPATGAPAVTDFVGTAQDYCWGPGEGILMTAYDLGGEVVAQEFNSGSGNLVTFSFPEPTVAKLRMEEFQQGIDDFTFNIPVLPGWTGVREVESAREPMMSLRVVPNPGRVATGISIHFANKITGPSTVCVYDLLGRHVRTFSREPRSAGAVEWNGRDDRGNAVASGVYLIRWTAPDEIGTARVMLIR